MVKVTNELKHSLNKQVKTIYKTIMEDFVKVGYLPRKVNLEILANIAEMRYEYSQIHNEQELIIEFVYFGETYTATFGHRMQEAYMLYVGEDEFIVKPINKNVRKAFSLVTEICTNLRLTDYNFSNYGFKCEQGHLEGFADGLDRIIIKGLQR